MSFYDYKHDLKNLDYGSARRRLASYIACTRYDPDVCSEIGDICVKMHDPMEAARWYLIGSKTSDQIEACIDDYFHSTREHPNTIIAKIPGKARLANTSDYPAVVQDRFRRILIENRDIKGDLFKSLPEYKPTFRDNCIQWGCIIVFYSLLGCAALGIYTIGRWLYNLSP